MRTALRSLAVGLLLASAAATDIARAADPAGTSLTVPGDGGPTTGSWRGPRLSGTADPTGPPAAECLPNQCDEEKFSLFSRDPNYTKLHTLTLNVWIDYDATAGRVFDVALFDLNHRLLTAAEHVAPGQVVAVSHIRVAQYYAQVDSDGALQPTNYTGWVSLSATNAPTPEKFFTAAPGSAPPLSAAAAHGAGLPPTQFLPPTIGPGVSAPPFGIEGPANSAFGRLPPRAPARPTKPSSGSTWMRWLVIAGIAAALTWFGARFREAWRNAGTTT